MIRDLALLARIARRPWLGPAALRRLQERRLRALVRHAYERVPYYGERFREAGVSPEDVRTLDDLRRLPVTTKRDLHEAGPDATLARGLDRDALREFRTSGSTGEPFTLWLSTEELRERRMAEFRGLVTIGFRPGDVLASVGPERAWPRGIHQRLGLFRRAWVDPSAPVADQLAFLARVRPSVLWAYPSQLEALVDAADGRLSAYARPRILITSAARLDAPTRDAVERDFDAEIFVFYGAIETGRIGWECRAHDGLHLNADRLILEVVEEPGAPEGTVVVTVLAGRAMPFIRYRLGDVVAPLDRGRCPCGVRLPRISGLVGREAEVVFLPSGRKVSSSPLDFALRGIDGVERYLFLQESRERLDLLVVPRPGADLPADVLRGRVEERLEEPIEVGVRFVDALPEQPPGKRRNLIRRLDATDDAGEGGGRNRAPPAG